MKDLCYSMLNGNVILKYHLPFDENNSGLSVIGTRKVDKTVSTIFDWQRAQGLVPRLVHVPEFTVKSLNDQMNFILTEEKDYNEYLVATSALFPLGGTTHNFRRKVKKFISEAGEENVTLQILDLSDTANQQLLLTSIENWWDEFGAANDGLRTERGALQASINMASKLGLQNICLFVYGKLEGFALYQIVDDGKMIILNHLKVRYEIPRIFDFLTFVVARQAAAIGAHTINFEMDLGIPGLRMHKHELNPYDYFRKYEIRPNVISSQWLSPPTPSSSIMNISNVTANSHISTRRNRRAHHSRISSRPK